MSCLFQILYIDSSNSHNPLGKVFTQAELSSIGDLCVKYELILLSDEVYEHLVFESPTYWSTCVPHTRVASLSPAIAARTLTAVSLGKLFNATGWRVGFVIGAADLMRPIISTHLVLAYTASSPAQEACVTGFRQAAATDWWTSNVRDVFYRIVRISQALEEVGLTVSYVFFDLLDASCMQDDRRLRCDASSLRQPVHTLSSSISTGSNSQLSMNTLKSSRRMEPATGKCAFSSSRSLESLLFLDRCSMDPKDTC